MNALSFMTRNISEIRMWMQMMVFSTVRRWLIGFVSAGAIALTLTGGVVHAQATQSSTVTVWLQVMDSCQQALPGATVSLSGKATGTEQAGPTPGTKPTTVASAHGKCPLQRGNCATIARQTGCVSWAIPIPTSGTATYTISQVAAPNNYAPCTGGSACRNEYASFIVSSSGAVSGTVTNIYPDGKKVTWPSSGFYTATATDPLVFHDFGLGNGSCDGDNDADDHLTGSPSSHCDSDGDKGKG